MADLGSGRLHRNVTSHLHQSQGSEGGWGWRRRWGNKGTNSKSNADDNGNDDGAEEAPLVRRESGGNSSTRLLQGEQAVWGGRGAPPGESPDNNAGGRNGVVNGNDMDWWETGTRYAFQPRLAADKPTVLSVVDTTTTAVGQSDLGGVGTNEREEAPRKTSGNNHGLVGELMRIVRVPEHNENHGRRVFFVAR